MKAHFELTSTWMDVSNYICILEAKDAAELQELTLCAAKEDIAYSIFKEPDMNDAITAIALAPGKKTKKLCSKLPLALKE